MKENLEIIAKILLRCILFSVAILAFWSIISIFAGKWAYQIHKSLFAITEQQFVLLMYGGIGLFKLLVFIFFLLPYISILLVIRKLPAGKE